MEEIGKRLQQAIKKIFGQEIEPELTVPPAETGADYATNVAMRLAKPLHKAPMQIAEALKAELETGLPGMKVEIAAPGFMNFISPDEYFFEKVAEIAQNEAKFEEFISCDEYSGKMVVAEFSDPNPFKVLHVGHFYTSVVGDAISHLLECAQAKVVRVNFGGDVGLHVGKTLWALLVNLRATTSLNPAAAQSQGDKPSSFRCSDSPSISSLDLQVGGDSLTIEDIAKCYVEGTRAYEENEEGKTEITKLNKIIYAVAELGEERSCERLAIENLAEDFGMATAEMARVVELYWRGRQLSYAYFEKFYESIGVKFDKFYPESTVAGKGLEEVRAHLGAVYEESDGAIVYRGEKVGLHTRVFINHDGVPTYETKDVGLLFTKWADWHFDESVVITGNEQTDYMKVVLASVNEYAPELVGRTRHLTHGLVKLPGNVKMSSRKGNFLKAVDVLEMVRDELGGEKADAKVVLAAIKYAFLKYKMGGDIIFDPKESVATNGNSGVYLLYSAVRAKKILQKVGAAVLQLDGAGGEQERLAEKNLSKKIMQYQSVLKNAITEKAPYKVCNYLYELAQEFSRFYEKVRVAGNPREVELKNLVKVYLWVMQHGLRLMGIEVPEEM